MDWDVVTSLLFVFVQNFRDFFYRSAKVLLSALHFEGSVSGIRHVDTLRLWYAFCFTP